MLGNGIYIGAQAGYVLHFVRFHIPVCFQVFHVVRHLYVHDVGVEVGPGERMPGSAGPGASHDLFVIMAVPQYQLYDIGSLPADQLPAGCLDDRGVALEVGFLVDDHIFQEAVVLSILAVYLYVEPFKITEYPLHDHRGRLKGSDVLPQVVDLLFRKRDDRVGKIKGNPSEEDYKNDQVEHGALQGDPGGLHGGKFIVLGECPESEDGGEQYGERKYFLRQVGHQVK